MIAPKKAGDIGTIAGTGEKATDAIDANADGIVDNPIAASDAHFDSPLDTMRGPDGQLYIIDWNGHKIRSLKDGEVSFVVGTGIEGDGCEVPPTDQGCPAYAAELNHPTDMAFDSEGRMVIAAWHNAKIKRLDFTSNAVIDLCGTGDRKFLGDNGPCEDSTGLDLVAFDLPSSVVYDSAGNLFIADQANQVIRRLGADGIVKTVAGNCPSDTKGFGCIEGKGYAGDGGPATLAKLNNSLGQGTDPQGKIALDAQGNLYIADSGNNRIRKVTPGADAIIGDGDPAEEIITTIAGNGTAGYSGDGGQAVDASLNEPTDVEVAPDGTLYIADRANSCIRKVTTDGIISTVAGVCGVPGFEGDGGPALKAHLRTPYGIELDDDGSLYIADTLNHCIREVLPGP